MLKSICSLMVVLSFSSAGAVEARKLDKHPEVSSTTKKVNDLVASLDARIKDGDPKLQVLKVDHELGDATEGVPPSLKFYFEFEKIGGKEKAVLRAVRGHVGMEVFAKEIFYYFYASGRPMKFLRTVTSVPGPEGHPPGRWGVIYDEKGKRLWRSDDAETPDFKKISSMFDTIIKTLDSI